MFEYLNTLNKEQKEVATSIDGPILIIAGAGSGKTTTLISRLSYMIDNGINPKNILLLTFTNEAAKNMLKKATNNSNSLCQNVTACTYHSFCANLLRKYGEIIDIPNNYTILSSSDEEDIIRALKQKNTMYKQKEFPSNKNIISFFSYITNLKLDDYQDILYMAQHSYSKIVPFMNEIMILKEEYEKYKKDKDLLNYDDLLVKTLDLLQYPDYKNKIQEQYQYIMVDEYQDTNKLQEDIVLTLSDKYHNLAVVGDDYQSIYAFRGSDINNIINFPKKVDNCKQITLHKNYRSSDEIINLANNIMSHHANFGYNKQMTGTNKNYNLPFVNQVSTITSEAQYVYDDILEKHKQGISYKDISILSRTSNETAQLEALLNKNGIPYVKKGGIKFFEHDCIRDILAYMKVSFNQRNELAWVRVLDVIPGIGDTYSAQLASYCDTSDFLINNKFQNKSFYDDLIKLNELYKKLNNNFSMLEQFQKIKSFYISLRQKSIDNLVTSDEGNRTQMQDLLNNDIKTIDILKDMLKGYDSFHQFLDEIILNPNELEQTNGDLTLSTIHSAKGLEWDYVYILNPINEYIISNQSQQEFDESLRCFYVAITRAKKELHFVVPDEFSYANKSYSGLTNVCFESYNILNFEKLEKYNTQNKKYVYLNIPFHLKDNVKRIGGRWNPDRKKWYVSEEIYHQNPWLQNYLY